MNRSINENLKRNMIITWPFSNKDLIKSNVSSELNETNSPSGEEENSPPLHRIYTLRCPIILFSWALPEATISVDESSEYCDPNFLWIKQFRTVLVISFSFLLL